MNVQQQYPLTTLAASGWTLQQIKKLQYLKWLNETLDIEHRLHR